jgi:hypothetical protein
MYSKTSRNLGSLIHDSEKNWGQIDLKEKGRLGLIL